MPTVTTLSVGYNKPYTTIQSAFDFIFDTKFDLVANDEQITVEIGRPAAGINQWGPPYSNFVSLGKQSDPYKIKTDPTRYVKIVCEPGLSFTENPNRLDVKLQYNPNNGIAFAIPLELRANHTVVDGIQMRVQTNSFANGQIGILAGASERVRIRNCLIESWHGNPDPAKQNSALYLNNNASVSNTITLSNLPNIFTNNVRLQNCNFIGSTYHGVAPGFSMTTTGSWMNNCVIIGYSRIENPANWFVYDPTSSNNATDLAVVPQNFNNAPGCLSINKDNQFISIDSADLDARLKIGSILIGKGVRSQQYTNDLDILRQQRSLASPTIGAYEVPANVIGSILQSDQTISKGIARGIERGIV